MADTIKKFIAWTLMVPAIIIHIILVIITFFTVVVYNATIDKLLFGRGYKNKIDEWRDMWGLYK